MATASFLAFPLEAAHDVARPGAALHEGQDEQHAHGQVLQRVGEPVRDRVGRGARPGVRPGEPAEHERERYEQHEDDDAGDADRPEALQVAKAYLARGVHAEERQRDRGERGHDVELERAGPADHEGDDVGRQHHDPADEAHDEHGDERRDVVVGGDDGHLGQVERASGAEERLDSVDGEPADLVDRRHQVEAVLYEEQEHGEEHEEENDLLDAGKALAAVHALGDLDELQGEDQAEHPAPDRQDGNLPYAPGDVVHGQVARAREHVREVGREDPVRADRPEHARLRLEHPVAAVAQEAAQPIVDVPGDVGVCRLRGDEQERAEGECRRGGDGERPSASRFKRPHGYIASSEPPRETTVTTVEAGSSSVKVVDATFPA